MVLDDVQHRWASTSLQRRTLAHHLGLGQEPALFLNYVPSMTRRMPRDAGTGRGLGFRGRF